MGEGKYKKCFQDLSECQLFLEFPFNIFFFLFFFFNAVFLPSYEFLTNHPPYEFLASHSHTFTLPSPPPYEFLRARPGSNTMFNPTLPCFTLSYIGASKKIPSLMISSYFLIVFSVFGLRFC